MELLTNVSAWRCIAFMGIVTRLTAGFGLLLGDQSPPADPGPDSVSDLQTLALAFSGVSDSQHGTTDTPKPVHGSVASEPTSSTTHPDHVLNAINVLQTYISNTKANTQAMAEPEASLTSLHPGNTVRTPGKGSSEDLESISNLLSQLNVGNTGAADLNSFSGSSDNVPNNNTVVSKATDTVLLPSLHNILSNIQNAGADSNSNTIVNSQGNSGGTPVQSAGKDTLENSGQAPTSHVSSNALPASSSVGVSQPQSSRNDAPIGSNGGSVAINAVLNQQTQPQVSRFPRFNPQLFTSQTPAQQHPISPQGETTSNKADVVGGTSQILAMTPQQSFRPPNGFQGFNVGGPPEPNLETFQPLFGNGVQAISDNTTSNTVPGIDQTGGPIVQPNTGRQQTQTVGSNPVQLMSTNSNPNMNQRRNTIPNQVNLVQSPQPVTYYRTPQGQLLRVLPYQQLQTLVPVQGSTPRVGTSERPGVNSQLRIRQTDQNNGRILVSPQEQPTVNPQNVQQGLRFAQMPYRNRMSNPYILQRRRFIRPSQRYPYSMFSQRYQNLYQQPAYNTVPSRLRRPRYPGQSQVFRYQPLQQRGPEPSQQVSTQSQPASFVQGASVQPRPGFVPGVSSFADVQSTPQQASVRRTFNGVGQQSSDGANGISSSNIPESPQRPSNPILQIASVNPVEPPQTGNINPQGSPYFGMFGNGGQAMRSPPVSIGSNAGVSIRAGDDTNSISFQQFSGVQNGQQRINSPGASLIPTHVINSQNHSSASSQYLASTNIQ